jgi:hypothetical protein
VGKEEGGVRQLEETVEEGLAGAEGTEEDE